MVWCALLMRALHALGCALVLAVFVPSQARAQCKSANLSPCINSDTYWPNAGPMRFAAVAGTETVAAGQIGFGLVTSYQSRPVILRVASPGSGTDTFVVDDQVSGNFLFAYGVTNRLELDLALPVTFVQRGAGLSAISGGASLRDTAVRDLRVGLAYALVARERVSPEKKTEPWGVAARFGFTAPTGDANDFAGERSAVFVPDIAASYTYQRLFAGADVGFRFRPTTEFAGARVGTQLTTAMGIGADILERERLAVLLEGRAYVNFAEQATPQQSPFGLTSIPNGKSIVPAEWFLGLRSAPILAGDVTFLLGGGGPIPLGDDAAITVPRFRFVLAAVYAPLARDTDGDGVLDKYDLCPMRPGERGGERPGCPANEESPK
jgi:hypothetical protein